MFRDSNPYKALLVFQSGYAHIHIYIYPLHILWDEWKLFGGYHQADGTHDGVHRHTGYFAAYNLITIYALVISDELNTTKYERGSRFRLCLP